MIAAGVLDLVAISCGSYAPGPRVTSILPLSRLPIFKAELCCPKFPAL